MLHLKPMGGGGIWPAEAKAGPEREEATRQCQVCGADVNIEGVFGEINCPVCRQMLIRVGGLEV